MLGVAAAHMESAAARDDFQDHNTAIQSTQKRGGGTIIESEASGDEDGHPSLSSAQIRARESSHRAASDVIGSSDCKLWIYKDHNGSIHGPYSEVRMAFWFTLGYLRLSLPVRRLCDKEFKPLKEVIRSCGKLPFRLQNPPPRASCDQRPPRAAVEAALPANPGVRAAAVFVKLNKPSPGKLVSIPNSQVRQPQTVRIRVLPIASEETSPVKSNQATPDPSAGFDKAPLGVRYSAPFPEDKHEKDVKMLASDSEDSWGDYQKSPQAARSQPSLDEKPADNRQSPATRPLTWAQVCQQPPGESRQNEPFKQERVAIENMARFPSLGGAAFTSSAQKTPPQKNLERRADPYEEFVRWSYVKLKSFPSYVHVPTFFELLRDLDSEAEIEEYARMHLGPGEEVWHFVVEFLQRKSQCKKLAGRTKSAVPRPAGLGGKGRKKMQKVDSSMLGFVMAKEAPKKV